MKKYINICLLLLCSFGIVFLNNCSDDKFENKPKPIDPNSIEITPTYGGLKIEWTPDPMDENLVFLHVDFIDHDNTPRSYSISRYGSSLINPKIAEENNSSITKSNNGAVTLEILDLINQEYVLHLSGYNNDNKSIDLGTRVETPNDYMQCLPDSIFAVNITPKGGRMVAMEWKEFPLKASSTTEKVLFSFTHKETGLKTTQEYDLGIRHAEFRMEKAGEYTVEHSTLSAMGKEWKGVGTTIEVIQFYAIDYWTAEQKKGWSITGTSVQESEGPFAKLIDGKKDSFWASSWSNASLPVTLDITLNEPMDVVGVILQQRQNCSAPSWHRCVKHFSIYLKENESDSFPDKPNYRGELKQNTIESGGDHLGKQSFNFEVATKAKYIRLSIDGSMFSPSDGNDSSTQVCMAEFGVMAKDNSKED